jgi:hypothetical protein
LLTPGGARRIPLQRATFKDYVGGQFWLVDKAGGQCAFSPDAKFQMRGFLSEVNFFHLRSRSMIVVQYAPMESPDATVAPRWRLHGVSAVPFRDQLSESTEPARPHTRDWRWRALLDEQVHWSGSLQRIPHGVRLSQEPESTLCEPFRVEDFAVNDMTAAFVDGLVCSFPEHLPVGAPFVLNFGCRLDANHFIMFTQQYDADHKLASLELRRFERETA